MNIDRIWLVRPNLGNPLILEPEELQRFTITLAYKKPWRAKESTIEWPSPAQLHTLERSLARGAGAMRLVWKNIGIPLKVYKVHSYYKHPEFKDNYGAVKHAITSFQQQYRNGFRWEMKVDVGISETDIEKLQHAAGWPAMLNLESRFHSDKHTNHHAIYVHQTMKRSEKLTILHITDTHITKRYDLIPGILCSVRNEVECESLKRRYNNFNDHLRAFIMEANKRVDEGENVIVVHTGDITDYFFDGYWDGMWACGQGGGDNRDKLGGASNSNVSWFVKIITGNDGRSEPLRCPIFTIIGNHEYYPNEILLHFLVGSSGVDMFIDAIKRREDYNDLNLSDYEEREYDFFAFPTTGKRPLSDRKTFKEIIGKRRHLDNLYLELLVSRWKASLVDFAGDKSFWLIKPKSWILDHYLLWVNYDLDFDLRIGKRHLLFFNTGNDLFPNDKLEFKYPSNKLNYDYTHGGPHCRGITQTHLRMLRESLREEGEKLIFVFTHAPLVQIQGAPEEKEDPDITYWYEQNLDYENEEVFKKANLVFSTYYDDVWKFLQPRYNKIRIAISRVEQDRNLSSQMKVAVLRTLRAKLNEINAFLQEKTNFINPSVCPKGCFKSGHRKMVDYFCAEGYGDNQKLNESLLEMFLHDICREDEHTPTDKPVLMLSGHTHKVHEFRIARPRREKGFWFYLDNYSSRYFPKSENAFALMLRYGLIKSQSPFLMTSGSLRNSPPRYREIVVQGLSIVSLVMKEIDMKEYDFSSSPGLVSFKPGCELITLRAHNGQYVCAESGGNRELFANRRQPAEWEIFELVHLEGNKVALKAVCNGKFIRAEGGGGGRLRPDRHWIKEHETFILVSKGDNKIALRTHNGKYVCAEGGGGRELIANRDWAREWETFEINKAPLYAPSLIAPKNGKKYKRELRSVTLRWNTVAGAVGYGIEVEGKIRNSWSQVVSLDDPKKEMIYSTQYRLNVIRRKYLHFRWRVWAIGIGDINGPKSNWSYFEFRPTL